MDAAIVEVSKAEWNATSRASHSTVVGYKPVRLINGRGIGIDADVVEHSGFAGGTVFGEQGQEPLNAVYLIMNKWLADGDSGCVVIDCEFERSGPAFLYLVYLGVTNLKLGGQAGYGLLLEQARVIWNLQFYK